MEEARTVMLLLLLLLLPPPPPLLLLQKIIRDQASIRVECLECIQSALGFISSKPDRNSAADDGKYT
jgi:hypothetical protein